MAERSSLAAVLDSLGISCATAVVEHNGVIVPREQFEATAVGPGDRLELVRFMGGG
ncbi:MAG: sulfur carrier protein ThiS [Myxococcota bacterium]|nr:sulfur carrier protein ThiS [Myxococcota bacterium]